MKKKNLLMVISTVAVVMLMLGTAAAFAVGGMRENKEVMPAAQINVQPTTPEYNTTPVTIQFAGDVLLHESTAGRAEVSSGVYNFDSYFDEVKKYIDCDIGLVDIEGCVDYKGENKSLAYYPYFNVPSEIVPALKKIGFTTVITANNHAWDYGFEGMKGTVKSITDGGMEQLGNYITNEDAVKPYIKEVNTIKVGICSWTDSTNGNYMSDEYSSFCTKRFDSSNFESAHKIIEDINSLKKAGADFVICCLHWGTEYMDNPSDMQRKIAKAVIDGGADIIVGNHPHCIQPCEKVTTIRDGKQTQRYIFYACGNFIADQIVLEKDGLKTQQSVLGTLKISRNAETGAVEIDDISYLPLVTHAYYSNGVKSTYKVLALKQLASNPIECNYASSTYFSDSYKRVSNLMGTDVRQTDITQ